MAVYLQDIDKSPAPDMATGEGKTEIKTTTGSATNSLEITTTTTSKAGIKRQRTLADMFTARDQQSKSTSMDGHGQPAKKLKISASDSGTLVSSKSASSSASTPRLNAVPFSLSQFVESLPEDQRALLDLESQCMGKSWLKLLKDEIRKPYFLSLKKFLLEEGVKGPNDSAPGLKVYPSPSNIYTWSHLTPLGRVKIVILGQDPYHGPKQAHGLAFSVPMGVAVPPSLRNIYAEIKAEYPEFEPPSHGNLSAWAQSGVLLLNTCLTVHAGQAGSHAGKGWETFTEKVVDVAERYGGANIGRGGEGEEATGHGRGVVFLAWGSWAAKRVAKLDKTKHLILTSAHPSPLSAHKGFLGNGHFRAANDWLEKRYGPEGKVDWTCFTEGVGKAKEISGSQ